MTEAVNVTFAGELQKFIQNRVGASGLYGSASEYIHDLVRHDYEREEQRKEQRLRQELKAGAEADASEFLLLDADSIIADARTRRAEHGR